MEVPNPKIALSMGSSYMGFYAHAGFLAGLEKGGVVPGHLAGASSGGVIAGLSASGMTAADIEGVIMDRWFPKYFYEWSILLRGWGVLFNLPGFGGPVSGAKLRERLAEVVRVERIEDCPRSLHVAATNLTCERAEMVAEGPLAEFLVASCAMPFVFRPQVIGGAHYWDGGITHDLPLSQWVGSPDIETVVGHRITWKGEGAPIRGKLKISDAFNLSHRSICKEGMRNLHVKLEDAGKRIVLVRTLGRKPGVLMPVERRKEIYRAGFESGLETAESVGGTSKIPVKEC